jgi:hypothetical protein
MIQLTVDNSTRAAWCWIAQNYPYERFFFHYCSFPSQSSLMVVFVFINIIALTVVYGTLFSRWYRERRRGNNSTALELVEAGINAPLVRVPLRLGTTILWYPLVYVVLTMPLSVARLESMISGNWGITVVFVGAALYAAEGLCTVLLYTSTREGVICWDWFVWLKLPEGIRHQFQGR